MDDNKMLEALTALGITSDDIVAKAAQMLLNQDHRGELVALVKEEVKEEVRRKVAESLKSSVETVLQENLQEVMSAEFVPLNQWGEQNGEATTIRDELAKQARAFWTAKVDREGRPCSSYSSVPRHEWLYKKVVRDEFAAVAEQQATNIVADFKDALREDLASGLDKHLNAILKVTRKKN